MSLVVTLNELDGIETKVVVPEGLLARPEDPKRTGFRFDGWYYDEAFERSFDFERDIVNSSITLYAKWVPLPQASVTTLPFPVAGLTYTGSLQELVTAGGTDDGTLHYAIGDGTGTAPVTGWSTSVPRQTDAGTYRVWYKVVADAGHLDSDPRYVDAAIGRSPIEPSVYIDSWTEGETPSEPHVTGNPGGGAVTFRYSRANTADWSSERPSTSGDYVVEATVAQTDNYLGNTCRTSFSVLAKAQPTPTPHPSPTPTPTPLPSPSLPTTPWSYPTWGLGLMTNAYSVPSWRDLRPYDRSSGSRDETTQTTDTTNTSGTRGTQTVKRTTAESTTANGTAAGGPAVVRLAGQDRYQTMAAICSQAFASSKRAVVASGDRFPDALAASGLAGAMDCPVVLTAGTTLSAEARSELSRLGVTGVTIVGGPAAVSEACRLELEAMGLHVTRIAGADRQATSVAAMAAARAEDPSSDTVVVASGSTFADALSAGPWAYRSAAPVLLAGNDGTLPHEALEALRADGRIKRVLVVGGDAVVSPMVEKQLGDYAVERVGGKDRCETSAMLARWAAAHGSTHATVGVATGRTFPDALAPSALLGSRGGVLLLADSADGPVKDLLSDARGKVSTLFVLGGASAVGEPIAAALASAAA